MMTREENELLTRVGPGMPAGELLRRFWQIAALSEELPVGGPPKSIRLFGEDLVLFRDDKDRPGLLDIHCSHRRADLSFGRIENGGLRCLYHGWLYDITGRCLEQPSEPDGGKNRDAIRHTAYPCKEIGGLIFSYMGPGEPPPLPAFECLNIPSDHRFIKKYLMECNYLQGAEGDVDPTHPSFLHAQFDVAQSSSTSIIGLYAKDLTPQIEVEPANFGMRIYTLRRINAAENYLRTSYFLMPNLFFFPEVTGLNGYTMNSQVPIDDAHHWKYQISFSRDKALDLEKWRKTFQADITPDYRLIRNLRNQYLQDRDEMKTRSFAGLGRCFAVHDAFATESGGAIQDRTREHLVSTDFAIIAFRKLLLNAIRELQKGGEPPRVPINPATGELPFLRVISEVIPSSVNPKDYMRYSK